MISGKDQVAVGIVPLDAHHQSSQSAKSVYPLVIANYRDIYIYIYICSYIYIYIINSLT